MKGSNETGNAAVAQSVERRIGSAEVTGPIPVSSSGENVGNLDFSRLPIFYFTGNCAL